MSTDIAATRRQLKIKTGSVKRLLKEIRLYTKEAEDNRLRLEKLRADGAEDWDLKNATLLIGESEKMVKDATTRLGTAAGELKDLINLAQRLPEFSADEEFLRAKEALEEASI